MFKDEYWSEAVEKIEAHVVRISTPQGSGTGWLVNRSKRSSKLCAIVTAAHVVDQAHMWETPIRILHPSSGKSQLLRHAKRAIVLEDSCDTAGILFKPTELPLPDSPLKLIDKGSYVKIGVEVGWLGYPAVAPANNVCFFSGRISSVLKGDNLSYLVDGVAINGVSGGPVFYLHAGETYVVGLITAYIPNRSTGEVLPGVSVVQDIFTVHEWVSSMKSFDDAKDAESVAKAKPPVATPEAPESK